MWFSRLCLGAVTQEDPGLARLAGSGAAGAPSWSPAGRGWASQGEHRLLPLKPCMAPTCPWAGGGGVGAGRGRHGCPGRTPAGCPEASRPVSHLAKFSEPLRGALPGARRVCLGHRGRKDLCSSDHGLWESVGVWPWETDRGGRRGGPTPGPRGGRSSGSFRRESPPGAPRPGSSGGGRGRGPRAAGDPPARGPRPADAAAAPQRAAVTWPRAASSCARASTSARGTTRGSTGPAASAATASSRARWCPRWARPTTPTASCAPCAGE